MERELDSHRIVLSKRHSNSQVLWMTCFPSHKRKGTQMILRLNEEGSFLTPVASWRWCCNDLCGLVYSLHWGSLPKTEVSTGPSFWLQIDAEENQRETECISNLCQVSISPKAIGRLIINKWLSASGQWCKKHSQANLNMQVRTIWSTDWMRDDFLLFIHFLILLSGFPSKIKAPLGQFSKDQLLGSDERMEWRYYNIIY